MLNNVGAFWWSNSLGKNLNWSNREKIKRVDWCAQRISRVKEKKKNSTELGKKGNSRLKWIKQLRRSS